MEFLNDLMLFVFLVILCGAVLLFVVRYIREGSVRKDTPGQGAPAAPAAPAAPKEQPAQAPVRPVAAVAPVMTARKVSVGRTGQTYEVDEEQIASYAKEFVVFAEPTYEDLSGEGDAISLDLLSKFSKGLLPKEMMGILAKKLQEAGLYLPASPASPAVLDQSSPTMEEVSRLVDEKFREASAGSVRPQETPEDFQPSAAPARTLPDCFKFVND